MCILAIGVSWKYLPKGSPFPANQTFGSISRKNGDATMKFITPCPLWKHEHRAKWRNAIRFNYGKKHTMEWRDRTRTNIGLSFASQPLFTAWYGDHKTVDADFKLVPLPKNCTRDFVSCFFQLEKICWVHKMVRKKMNRNQSIEEKNCSI